MTGLTDLLKKVRDNDVDGGGFGAAAPGSPVKSPKSPAGKGIQFNAPNVGNQQVMT